ncbi:uncharacterized protein PV09_05181 [Verruconis gallopava]|uniref:Iron-sulfur cluster assembly factor IBA57 homolog, mitochondrial n=1 Tax=Verruconis gallopava TaxID=253628 RepID=A0A0D2AAT0_9PEZI|nr:uncharacterized protein PV09_05181 [Verruconis gallopava]KIW03888.1 hypothetical protein PV09_05181 [Verruconis gallopava]
MQSLLQPFSVCSQCFSRAIHQIKTSFSFRNFSSAHLGLATTPNPVAAFAELPHRGFVLLSGYDAPKFLQGLTTNNVEPSRETPWYSGFLSAQGRVLWDVIIYPYRSSNECGKVYLVEVERDEVGSFIKHLKRHKLRSQVTIRDASEEWHVFSAWSSNGISPVAEMQQGSGATEGAIVTVDPRLPSLGHRIVLNSELNHPAAALPEFYGTLPKTSTESYTIRRYLQGVPEGQHEIIKESALPMESNMDYLNGIDFRKGCYVGQELTIRTQHTGVIRKRILPIQLYDADAPSMLSYMPSGPEVESGADIKAEGGKRPVGKLLTSIGNIGLALCRLENMTDLRVSAEGGSFKPGMEFNVALKAGNGRVKIKAFVPEWLRIREKEKMDRRAKREEPILE